MEKLLCFVLLASSATLGQASKLTKQDTCTPSSAGNSSVDDVPAIMEALSICGNGGTIIIPAGETFMIGSPLDFGNCSACYFQIEGTLKVSDDLDYWEGKTAFFLLPNVTGANIWFLDWIRIDWWEAGKHIGTTFASNKTYRRPLLLQMSNASDITFTNFKLKNAPFWFLFVTDGSTNIKFSGLAQWAPFQLHSTDLRILMVSTRVTARMWR